MKVQLDKLPDTWAIKLRMDCDDISFRLTLEGFASLVDHLDNVHCPTEGNPRSTIRVLQSIADALKDMGRFDKPIWLGELATKLSKKYRPADQYCGLMYMFDFLNVIVRWPGDETDPAHDSLMNQRAGDLVLWFLEELPEA